MRLFATLRCWITLRIMKTIRNEKYRSELISRLNKLVGDESAAWGKMNVDQMMSHLVQAWRLLLTNIPITT